ncbi:NAD(+) kinase [Vibrio crassostreae]|uniref:NAD(+) kinase n=1 Tax=Vibrio crassostreae TaxID=246167 RepID=UPI001B313A65|nr:NAD(+) kinase [Vibrio crassostreae]
MFNSIGIMGRPRDPQALETHQHLVKFISQKGKNVFLDASLKDALSDIDIFPAETLTKQEMGQQCDLIIVVGGDGNMLGSAREMAPFNIPMIGINRGNLGFLTDLNPNDFEEQLNKVIDGKYKEEKRALLSAMVVSDGETKAQSLALNETIVHAEKVAHMIEFEVRIDGAFAFSQRSDGLILSTPTGSTAYALSAGGAIMTPDIDAITLIPMFPHTLSCRPLIIDGSKKVQIVPLIKDEESVLLSCDGQTEVSLKAGDVIEIDRFESKVTLVHPDNHCYYKVLREKLGWASKLF